MPEKLLAAPERCCGKSFTVARALEAHKRTHVPCPHGCAWQGTRAALRHHLTEAHAQPERTAGGAFVRVDTSGAEYTRVDGSSFQLMEEIEPEGRSLEQRFPGRRLIWATPKEARERAGGRAGGRAGEGASEEAGEGAGERAGEGAGEDVAEAFSEEDPLRWSKEEASVELEASTGFEAGVDALPSQWRLILILGENASGKREKHSCISLILVLILVSYLFSYEITPGKNTWHTHIYVW